VPALSASFGAMMIVITLLGWSSIPLFLRHFAESIDAWTSNGWRYGFSALVWLPVIVMAFLHGGLPRGIWRAALVPSIVNAAGQVCFTWAHYRIDPGLLTFGLRSQLVFVAIGAWMLFPQERAVIRTRGYLFGAAILIIGMIGVVSLDGAAAEEAVGSDGALREVGGGSYVEGVLLALLSGALFAGYGLAVRKYMTRINSVLAFATICQYTAIVMIGLMLLFGARAGAGVLDMAGDQVAWLLISAVIGIALGHVFYYMSIARLGVAVSSGVLQLQPFIVAVCSLALFGEVLTAGQWVSGVVAVSGAMLMLATQYRRTRRARIAAGAAIAPTPPRSPET